MVQISAENSPEVLTASFSLQRNIQTRAQLMQRWSRRSF